jgi:predicted phosphodiesterase
MRFIGDIHGKTHEYRNIANDCDQSIQVGDFGVGFGNITATYVDSLVNQNHRFIRGNHDNPDECKLSKRWIGDGSVFDDMMLIGGANSIDKQYRIEGASWWRNEELSYSDLAFFLGKYESVKPRIMVTHDAPSFVIGELFNCFDSNRTRHAFDEMLNIHKPDIWIFGHWHKSADKAINGTRFICLAELEYIDLEI